MIPRSDPRPVKQNDEDDYARVDLPNRSKSAGNTIQEARQPSQRSRR